MLRARGRLASVPYVAPWARRGWPVIVRRATNDDDPALVPVALPLPPAAGKLRLAVQLPPEAIRERLPPLTLRAAREAAPLSWEPVVTALLALAELAGVEPRVFGSLLWQRLTGLGYLAATSDLDLLWPVADAACADRLVQRLASIAAESPVRLDGEILLPDGGGVQWREWHGGAAEVLVKTSAGVRLQPRPTLFSSGAIMR